MDNLKGGNVASPVRQVLRDWNFPLVFLPRRTDGNRTSNIKVFQALKWRDQRCDGRRAIDYEAVE